MKLKVGEFYLREDKTIVQLVRMATKLHNNESFVDSNLNVYVPKGFMISIKEDGNPVEKRSDIVAHIPKELHYRIYTLVKDYHTNNDVKNFIDDVYMDKCF